MDLAEQLRLETLRVHPHSSMMSEKEQVDLLCLLIQSIHAKRIIEVGVFTGYATLSMAKVLPEEAQLIACDTNQSWVDIGIPYWQQAGVAHKIQLEIAPAVETLQALLDSGAEHSFDFIFIDADKITYPEYYRLSLQLIRPHGLIVLDNMLWVGKEAVADQNNPATRTLHELQQAILQDKNVISSLLPVASGMLLVCK